MFISERSWQWVYPITATAGLLIALVLPGASTRVAVPARSQYVWMQVVTLIGAIIGAKLAMLAGDLGFPGRAVSFDTVLFSGRSLVGGLLGGFLAAELARARLGYREPPNDWFACKILLSVAVGRIGCILAGCCRGIPSDHPWSLTYSDGIPRFPVAPLELLFHLGMFLLCLPLLDRARYRGRIFALYMIVYGVFRIATEPYRETPRPLAGASVYQLLALCLAICGVASWIRARRFGASLPATTPS